MKKVLFTILIALFFFSCSNSNKENIDIYVEKNLILLMEDIAKIYENKNENIKINLYTDIPTNFENFEILISSNENILSNFSDTEKKKNSINYKDFFEKEFFTSDNIVIVGRKKLNSLNDLLYSTIAVSNYEDSVGQYFINELENSELFLEISKKIEYFEDSISAMQAADLYEVDYAVINTLLINNIKNSIVCYYFPKLKDNKDLISYNIYLKKESSSQTQAFYEFLKSTNVEKIINKKREIS